MLLATKSAVVTGAGQGIGLAIAKALAAEGSRVVVNDIQQEKAEDVAAEIVGSGGAAVANISDIATMAGAEALVTHCVEAFGGIDILVNNAGVLRDRMSYNMREAEWDAVVNVCLKGTFMCSKFASAEMRRQGRGGRIINPALVLQGDSPYFAGLGLMGLAAFGTLFICGGIQGYQVFVGDLRHTGVFEWPLRMLLIVGGFVVATPGGGIMPLSQLQITLLGLAILAPAALIASFLIRRQARVARKLRAR